LKRIRSIALPIIERNVNYEEVNVYHHFRPSITFNNGMPLMYI
jgi:hypothetical protein